MENEKSIHSSLLNSDENLNNILNVKIPSQEQQQENIEINYDDFDYSSIPEYIKPKTKSKQKIN